LSLALALRQLSLSRVSSTPQRLKTGLTRGIFCGGIVGNRFPRYHLFGPHAKLAAVLDAADGDWRASAANLAHYVALRSTGHVALQADLVRHGLSSLPRREAAAALFSANALKWDASALAQWEAHPANRCRVGWCPP